MFYLLHGPMDSGDPQSPDTPLYRRGQFLATLTRWISMGLGLLALALLWTSPRTRAVPALLVAAGWLAFHLASWAWLWRHPRSRAVKRAHDVVDGLAVALGAGLSGGLESPVWLLLYPHVVAVSVRGGLAYALAIGVMDAVIVLILSFLTPSQPLGSLHAVALLFCAFMGGTTSSYLRRVITRERRMEHERKAHAERLEAIGDIASAVNLSLTIEDIFDVAAEETSRLVAFDRLTIALREEEGPGLEIISVGRGSLRPRAALRAEEAAWAFEEPQSWCRAGGEPPPPHAEGLLGEGGLLSFASVPLVSKERAIGSLNLGRFHPHPFSMPDLAVMESVARHIAIAIENARLFERARRHLAEAREANRRLQELDRLRQEYLRNVSHEFRSPLTVIRGYSEYLAASAPPEPEALRELMRIVVESCDRLIDMVDTLIEVSRIEQGAAERTLQLQELDLREVVAACVDPLRGPSQRKGVTLALECAAEPLPVQGDGGLLQQVVRKLVDNAVKYSPPGSTVVIRARREGDERTVEVEDAGMGIAAEHLPHIFDKFYMVDGGLNRRVGGTGVGLYLVREIVRLHRGSVDVKSLPGKGSLFSVRLPRELKGAPSQAALA